MLMRISRFSGAITHKAVPERRTVFFRLDEGGGERLNRTQMPERVANFEGLAAIGRIANSAGRQREFLGQRQRIRSRSPD